MTTALPTRPDVATVPGVLVEAIDAQRLAELRATGIDHGGNAVEPFVDADGGWPLRCCLTDSHAGDELAIVAWSPFEWTGPYAEVGPIVIHAADCGGFAGHGVPAQFLARPQRLRPYGHDRRIAYDRLTAVDGDGSLPDALAALLACDDVDVVHVRNERAGCFSFSARRAPRAV
jgi:hypothetical protein